MTSLTPHQERRKVEDLYVQGLKKLARRPLPDTTSELGCETLELLIGEP